MSNRLRFVNPEILIPQDSTSRRRRIFDDHEGEFKVPIDGCINPCSPEGFSKTYFSKGVVATPSGLSILKVINHTFTTSVKV